MMQESMRSNFTLPYVTPTTEVLIMTHNAIVQNISVLKADGSTSRIKVVTNATHIFLNWFLKVSDRSEKWNLRAFKELDKLRKTFKNANYYFFSYAQSRKEDMDPIKDDMQLLAIGGVLLLFYCSLVTFNLSWKANRIFLTLSGLFSTSLTVSAAFGVMIAANIPLVSISLAIPFVVIG